VGAQGSLRFETPFVTRTISASSSDVATSARVFNTSGEPIRARWIREVNDLPEAWVSAVCDTNQCHLARIDSADFIIPAYGDAPLVPHVYPRGGPSDAQVTLRIVDLDDRSNNAVVTFSFPSADTPPAFARGARIYPNPGAETFEVYTDEALSRITLTNMLGKVVREYPAYLPSYDVRDLPNGLYLASLIGIDGRVIKTLRYSKRQVRP